MGKVKDNGRVATYDYKTRRADTIPFPPVEEAAELEVYRDELGVQNWLWEQLDVGERSKCAVVLAGNSGLPGGAVGLHTHILRDMQSPHQLLNAPFAGRGTYGTQEEDVVKNWLLSEHDWRGTSIVATLSLIFDEYGMKTYESHGPETKQGVNFNDLTKSAPSTLAHLELKGFPHERLYAEAVIVRSALLRPKIQRKPDVFQTGECVETLLVFVAGPNVGSKGSGDARSTTRRTFNTFLSRNESKFLDAVGWSYYAALHAIAMEGKRIALLPWISGDLYAGRYHTSYGVRSDGARMRRLIESVLAMRCVIQGRSTMLGRAFERVVLVYM